MARASAVPGSGESASSQCHHQGGKDRVTESNFFCSWLQQVSVPPGPNMATQGPTTTVTAMAGATPAGMTSRLAQMQMRFQQRQQQERDQRKVEMISTTKATAASVAAQHHTDPIRTVIRRKIST